MSIFDNFPSISKVISIAETVAEALRRLTQNDKNIQHWQERGYLNASFSIEYYEVIFSIRNKNKLAINAEVTPTEEAEK